MLNPSNQPLQYEDLVVVEHLCSFQPDFSQGSVCIECIGTDLPRAIEKLQAMTTRQLALGYAASRGVPQPAVNGLAQAPYAVNEDGTPLTEVVDAKGQPLPPQHPKMQPVRYRTDVPVRRAR